MAKNIEYRDNTEEVLKAMEAAIRRGNEAIGLAAEGHAKKKITQAGAVNTGRLRNSITYAIAGEKPHVNTYKANKKSSSNERRRIAAFSVFSSGGVWIFFKAKGPVPVVNTAKSWSCGSILRLLIQCRGILPPLYSGFW